MIDVKDLSFHYQGSKHQVFSHFNLQLEPGTSMDCSARTARVSPPYSISSVDCSDPTVAR